MPRRSSALPIIAGALVIFIIILLALSLVPRIPLPIGGFNIPGLRMTEEVNPPQVLYATTLNLEQGSVWQVTYDANGVHLQKKSSQLIERLNLSGVDLSVNDVVAPILYDWYFDGQDDYVYFHGFSTPNFTSIYVDVGIDAEVKNSKIFISWVPYHGPSIYFGITNVGSFWYETWNSTSTSVLEGRISNFMFGSVSGGYKHVQVVHTSTSITAYVNGESYSYTPLEDGPIHWLTEMKVGTLSGTEESTLKGRISYIYISQRDTLPVAWQVVENPVLFISATFFNGTHYFDLINGIAGTPYGGVARVPAEHPMLFLVKSLASDNKLHLKYVPPNSIFRIHYNGMVYEWWVSGTPNAAGLIEDYPIDIASIFGSTVLPNATVELIYPSEKVRVYVPSGFQVVVEGNGWSETHEVPLNASYVDFGLPSSGTYTIKVLGYEETPRIRVETSGNLVRVTVTDEVGYALSGAKVYVYDGNNVVATGYTNDLGIYEFNKSLLSSDQARIVVVHLSNGKYFHVDKLVAVEPQPRSMPQFNSVPQSAVASGYGAGGAAAAVALILLVGLAVVAVVLLGKRRRGASSGAAVAVLALVTVGVGAAAVMAAQQAHVIDINGIKEALKAVLPTQQANTSTTQTSTSTSTSSTGAPSNSGGGNVRVCWTAGGWLEYHNSWPDLWIQSLVVKLDDRVIYRYGTSGNGLMTQRCTYVSAGRHTMVATYRTINSELYVRKAWLGIDTRPHLAYNGLPYPTLYRVHKMYYNYLPDYSVHKVTITITFDASNTIREVHSEVSTG